MRETVIAVRGCTFGYNKSPVLENVDFTVEQGVFASVIGSNGMGKSTMQRLLLGELTPRRGEIGLFGVPVRQFHEWFHIGYLPQNAAARAGTFPATAAEIVSTGLYLRGGLFRLPRKPAKERVTAALAAVDMCKHAGRLIGELSGGQLQRVLLARALAGAPRLLLLDEPTAGVDAAAARSLYELLDSLRRERGLTVVMVTHDIARAAGYVDCAFCMEGGGILRIEREELARELNHHHLHVYPPRE